MTTAEGAGPGPALLVRGLTRRFGGVTAVADLDLEISRGEVLGVIGPNGAGKSTLVGLVSGAVAPTAGRIELDGRDITRERATARARLGIGRTHQIPRPFVRMTVLENMMLAADATGRHPGAGRWAAADKRESCHQLLNDTGLAGRASTLAGDLTLLQRKRLELARALALGPRVLLLDEIGAGLVESETVELIELIRSLRGRVEAMLVIEHVIEVITACCDRTVVLHLGAPIANGPTSEVLADERVAAVYLGTGTAAGTGPGAGAPSSPAAVPPTEPDPTGPDPGFDPGFDLGLELGSDAGPRPPGGRRCSAAAISRLVGRPATGSTGAAGVGSSEAAGSSQALLSVRGLAVHYGQLQALADVDLDVAPGECVALLGANGSGKTTLAHTIAGGVPVSAGRIVFDGGDITGLRPDRIARRGVSLCMEGRRILSSLTVEENLLLGADNESAVEARARLDIVYGIFPILAERRRHSGTAMSGGEQQMLAIGRALMSSPGLVIFDEISLGLSPIAVDQLHATLEMVVASGVATIVVEQHIDRGLALASRAYVLSRGRVVLSGDAAGLAHDDALRSVYVGAGHEPSPQEHHGTT